MSATSKSKIQNIDKHRKSSTTKQLRIPEISAQVLNMDTIFAENDTSVRIPKNQQPQDKTRLQDLNKQSVQKSNNSFLNRLPLKTKPLNIFESSNIHKSSTSFFENLSINGKYMKTESSQKNSSNKSQSQNNGSICNIQKEVSIIDLHLPPENYVKSTESSWKQKLIRKFKKLKIF